MLKEPDYKADTQEGFKFAPGACSRLLLRCQYTRGSVFKFAQFAP